MNREEIQQEALNATLGLTKCGLGLATGVGKTLVGLLHIERNYSPLLNILVVAPKVSIFASWRHDAHKFDKEKLLENATFTTYLSLNKHDPREYDIVYLDECHSLLDSHRDFLENFNGKVVGLTGTPPKYEQSEKGRMVRDFCPIVYKFITDEAVENKILNDYQIIVHMLSLDAKKNFFVKTKANGFMSSEALNYQYWTKRVSNGGGSAHITRVMRMKAMMEYPSKVKYAKILFDSVKTKCIVFANTQEQSELLCQHSYHSKNSQSESNLTAFRDGKIQKLSCVMQLNEGVNIPDLKQGIILHAYGNERKAAQRIGRLLRLNPNEKAIVHVLCYKETIDEKWVTDALEGFDQSKVEWKNYNIKLD
jgi:superfamily II DNA or RNA helicase